MPWTATAGPSCCRCRGPRGRRVRELLVARVNGLFGGKLTPESFAVQQPVEFGDAIASKLIEGEFLDINDYTHAGSIFRDGSNVMDRYLREQEEERKKKREKKKKGKTGANGATAPAGHKQHNEATPRQSQPSAGASDGGAEIIELGAVDVLTVTEMSPADGRFAGKQIERDNTIKPYPKALHWNWATADQEPESLV
jgi:hypothetical protein